MKVAKAQMQCLECGELFTANRIDQQFCSGRCKSKYHRNIQKEKMTVLERLFDRYVPKQDAAPHRPKVDLFA
jgi:predicted nucleic acid-binding Zn ribbon protein